MSLDLLHKKLNWPSPMEIRNPSGEGARIFVGLVKTKIEKSIALYPDASNAKVGVLLSNPIAADTEAPLAVVAEFTERVSDRTLGALQRLAWNFSHSPSVITIEPGLMRVWTCCEPPEKNRNIGDYIVEELSLSDLAKPQPSDITRRATEVLHWVNIASGEFFRKRSERFRRDRRADQTLLDNLQHIRHVLHKEGLTNDDICHDLLARIVFIQFLFDRKDLKGNSALNPKKLTSLYEEGVLRKEHTDFPGILEDYEETYRLFDWLNSKFNGDLFPGKGTTAQERAKGWRNEREHVKAAHLRLLREFIKGDLDMPTGQLCLWPQYSFDAIPLEFISSIYETFVREKAPKEGIYYTPTHLVDFILDRVLPWDSVEWNLKILDPACGSGVFLVKAFQRLIHRWKKANPEQPIRAEILRRLLEKNLFGVDKDPHAVRVASFSLYLAMCDEIEPKHYWTQVLFPAMREHRLINSDFFEENRDGFRSKEDAAYYDLVIGNAPWGENILTSAANRWAKEHQWPLANKGIGTLFLSKAAELTKPTGKIAMIQAASSLLFNRSRLASEFRKKFFSAFQVNEIVNLSALRFKVFSRKNRSTKSSVSPSCIAIFRPQPPINERFAYISPKQTGDIADESAIVLDPYDYKMVHPDDAALDSDIWSVLMWGQQRDRVLIKRLRTSDNLSTLKKTKAVNFSEGIIRGSNPNRQKKYNWLIDRHILETNYFPGTSPIFINASELPLNTKPLAERPRKECTFNVPQLLIKQSWTVETKRFQARLVEPDELGRGAICSQSYLSITAAHGHELILEAACLSCNSVLAVYFLLLTSGRFSSYRPEVLASEIPKIPIPKPKVGMTNGIKTYSEIDNTVRNVFELKDAEWVLVEDLFNVTLADFKGDADSPGRQKTRRRNRTEDEPELRRYCEYFIRVLKAGFGQDKQITATVFREADNRLLPYRLVSFELNRASKEQFHIETLDTSDILSELETLNRTWLSGKEGKSGSIYHERVARIYNHRDKTPTIFIIKPDAYRYWTRSMGLHDADEVALDFVRWQASKNAGTQHRKLAW